jgi:SAM-dependent methyltransferase
MRRGDATGWFEALYKEGEAGASIVPWADRGPSPGLLEFWRLHPQKTDGRKALVMGCGLGDDAEQLAAWGFTTTAFDIAETAIRTARTRFSQSHVNYEVADLFQPPTPWHRAFDFVFESNTVQALPLSLRSETIAQVASFVKPGGSLLVVARGREPGEPEGDMPWPLLRVELQHFVSAGLAEQTFENYFDDEDPPARRFRVLYTRPE